MKLFLRFLVILRCYILNESGVKNYCNIFIENFDK